MAVPKAFVPRRAYDEIGPDGVQMVLRHLYPYDCQTCNRPLGDQKPSLVFENWSTPVHTTVRVALHHPACHRAAWVDQNVFVVNYAARTHQYLPLCVTDTDMPGGRLPFVDPKMICPVILLNPSLESLFLERRDTTWHIDNVALPGLTPYDLAALPRAVPGNCLVDEGSTDPTNRFRSYSLLLEGTTRWHIRIDTALTGPYVYRSGGVLLAVTHGVEPRAFLSHASAPEDGGRAWKAVLTDPSTLLGWITLARADTFQNTTN